MTQSIIFLTRVQSREKMEAKPLAAFDVNKTKTFIAFHRILFVKESKRQRKEKKVI